MASAAVLPQPAIPQRTAPAVAPGEATARSAGGLATLDTDTGRAPRSPVLDLVRRDPRCVLDQGWFWAMAKLFGG
jgi:hypothetical protein